MIMPMITYHALKGTERILEGGNVMRLIWLPVSLEETSCGLCCSFAAVARLPEIPLWKCHVISLGTI
jgi:hypothetical protein